MVCTSGIKRKPVGKKWRQLGFPSAQPRSREDEPPGLGSRPGWGSGGAHSQQRGSPALRRAGSQAPPGTFRAAASHTRGASGPAERRAWRWPRWAQSARRHVGIEEEGEAWGDRGRRGRRRGRVRGRGRRRAAVGAGEDGKGGRTVFFFFLQRSKIGSWHIYIYIYMLAWLRRRSGITMREPDGKPVEQKEERQKPLPEESASSNRGLTLED